MKNHGPELRALREMLGGHVSERKYQQARAELLRSYCSEAIDCRYWDEGV